MTKPITLHIHRDTDYRKDARGVTVEKESLTAYITDDHIRAIVERSLQLGCYDWISKHTHGNGTLSAEWPNQFTYAPSKDPCSFGTIQPAAPADDEATAHKMWELIWEDSGESAITIQRHMGKIIAAIRRGEVPGLTTIDKCSDLINEHARAMNERDTLKAEVERLQADKDAWKRAERKAAHERDAAIARAEKAEAERDGNKTARRIMYEKLETARAAHAEAMDAITDWIDTIEAGCTVSLAEMHAFREAQYAKYGKDASK